jgi:hypothetical protein
MRGDAGEVDAAGLVLDDDQGSVESGLSPLSVFALKHIDAHQMTISLTK